MPEKTSQDGTDFSRARTGQAMRGWLLFALVGYAEDDDLKRGGGRAVAYATSLPLK